MAEEFGTREDQVRVMPVIKGKEKGSSKRYREKLQAFVECILEDCPWVQGTPVTPPKMIGNDKDFVLSVFTLTG